MKMLFLTLFPDPAVSSPPRRGAALVIDHRVVVESRPLSRRTSCNPDHHQIRRLCCYSTSGCCRRGGWSNGRYRPVSSTYSRTGCCRRRHWLKISQLSACVQEVVRGVRRHVSIIITRTVNRRAAGRSSPNDDRRPHAGGRPLRCRGRRRSGDWRVDQDAGGIRFVINRRPHPTDATGAYSSTATS